MQLSEEEIRLTLFQHYLEDLGRLGSRHESVRQFYMTVITALFALLALAGPGGLLESVRGLVLVVVGGVGVSLCYLWHAHMKSFREIFRAKRETLQEIENDDKFHVRPFTTEDSKLGKQHTHLTDIDQKIAIAFGVLFVALVVFKILGIGAPGGSS